MRVVSGFLKGRRFDPPLNKWKTRPTTDQAKESLFNILHHRLDLDELQVVDLYAGTGSIGYEFVSRGAARVVAVEQYAGCVRYIKRQAKDFNIEEQLQVQQQNALKWLAQTPETFDLIFADPPYAAAADYGKLIELVFNRAVLDPEGMLILEHDSRQNFAKHPNFVELRQYGQSYFSWLAHRPTT